MDAQAKINLSLDILGKRGDGYHDMCMIMQSLTLADHLHIQDSSQRGLDCNQPHLSTEEDNIVWKSVRAFYHALGKEEPPLHFHLEKVIPICAGLAGGSADGAATLRLLQQREGVPFTEEQLRAIGATVGADIPFCLLGGTALAEGIGERLTPLPSLPPCTIVLCKPPFPLSTPDLFRAISSQRLIQRPDTPLLLQALEEGDLEKLAFGMYNVFAQALRPSHGTVIEEIKAIMMAEGALGACMTGSGPTVFGLFAHSAKAEDCFAHLRELYPETFLTQGT